MASNTKKTELIRKRHHRSCGKRRRALRRANGSTPVFPIHPDKDQPTTPQS